MKLIIISLVCSLIPLLLLISSVDAVQGSPQYGIVLSKSCITMIKNNLTTNCPGYDEILALFPDNTNQRTSGEFSYIDGIFQRGSPKYLNPIQEYVYRDSITLWIDPPGTVINKIKTIVIHPSVPEYKIKIESTRMDDYNITFGIDRWINPNCTEANITAKDWIFLTGDTLNYMQHNCDPKFTNFDSTITKSFEKSYQNLAHSSKHKLADFVKEAKEKYKVSYIGSNDVNENKSVIEDEDE